MSHILLRCFTKQLTPKVVKSDLATQDNSLADIEEMNDLMPIMSFQRLNLFYRIVSRVENSSSLIHISREWCFTTGRICCQGGYSQNFLSQILKIFVTLT